MFHQYRESQRLAIGTCAAALIISWRIGDTGLIDGNESLYAQSALEMIAAGDAGLPTLNGVPYIEKPPAYLWLLVGLFRVFGFSEFVARAASWLAAIGTAGIMGYAAQHARFAHAWTVAFVAVTSAGVLLMGRVVMPDALLAVAFTAGCALFGEALEREQIAKARWAALAIALASLVKGFVAPALFAAITLLAALMDRRARPFVTRACRDPWVLALALGPLLAWVAATELRQPGAAHFFVWNEHVLRFLGLRQPRDYYGGGPFYHLPRLAAFLFPWTGVMVLAALRWCASGSRAQAYERFILAWILAPLAFFSISSAKSNYYSLLCLPPLAALTARELEIFLAGRTSRGFAAVLLISTAGLMGAVVAAAVANVPLSSTSILSGSPQLIVPGIAAASLALAGSAAALANRRLSALICCGAMAAPLLAAEAALKLAAEEDISSRPLARQIAPLAAGTPVYLYRDFEALGSLSVYLGRPLQVIDSVSADLDYGQRIRGGPTFVSTQSLLDQAGAVLIVVRTVRRASFVTSGLHAGCEVVARTRRAFACRRGAGDGGTDRRPPIPEDAFFGPVNSVPVHRSSLRTGASLAALEPAR